MQKAFDIEEILLEGGFSFENCTRNEKLLNGGLITPLAKKTGTTIAGVVTKDGVVLGADTRATSGPIVAEKNCDKIHFIAPNIWCCGAGTSADTESSTALVSSKLELHRLSTGRKSRVVTAMTMLKQMLFRYQGHVSAALVLGGYDDVAGPQLYTVWPHGSVDKLPYATMGSGSLAAMGVFEAQYRDDLTLEEGKKLVHAAISAGVFNDLGSGGNIDLLVITKDNVERLRGYDAPNPRKYRRERPYTFAKGYTPVLSEKIVVVEEEVVLL
eukprot:TRINITY_DN11646_c0_g1_i1.p2 TRINITY_DN11646_c0_g1~~TRINITY_DN11646_c0_g1_i1.p2  ORF type:complete len:270 (+),score=102.63 TRINITY_DN11646_c0_g1_i1:37-846(+)